MFDVVPSALDAGRHRRHLPGRFAGHRRQAATIHGVTLALAILLTVLTHVAFVGSRVTIALYGIHLGATPLTVGVLMSLYAFLPMLLAVYAGRQIDRIGPQRPMLYSSVGLVAAVALPGLWPSLAALHLAAMLIGTSFLFYHVALNNVIGQLGTPGRPPGEFQLVRARLLHQRLLRPAARGLRHRRHRPSLRVPGAGGVSRARHAGALRAPPPAAGRGWRAARRGRAAHRRPACASRGCAAPSSPAPCWRWAGTSTPS